MIHGLPDMPTAQGARGARRAVAAVPLAGRVVLLAGGRHQALSGCSSGPRPRRAARVPSRRHRRRVLRERREPEAPRRVVDRGEVVDRPRFELAVGAEDELRSVELVEAVVHAHAIGEVREVHGVGVVARDRDLEHLEAAALQPDVVDRPLRDEPRGFGAVGARRASSRASTRSRRAPPTTGRCGRSARRRPPAPGAPPGVPRHAPCPNQATRGVRPGYRGRHVTR